MQSRFGKAREPVGSRFRTLLAFDDRRGLQDRKRLPRRNPHSLLLVSSYHPQPVWTVRTHAWPIYFSIVCSGRHSHLRSLDQLCPAQLPQGLSSRTLFVVFLPATPCTACTLQSRGPLTRTSPGFGGTARRIRGIKPRPVDVVRPDGVDEAVRRPRFVL